MAEDSAALSLSSEKDRPGANPSVPNSAVVDAPWIRCVSKIGNHLVLLQNTKLISK